MQEFQEKLKRIHTLIHEEQIEGILFTRQKNVSWLTAGRSFVNSATEQSIASILITLTSSTLIVSNIEAERLMDEEFKMPFDQIKVFPWYEPERMGDFVAKQSNEANIQDDLSLDLKLLSIRSTLTRDEGHRVRELGRDTAKAIEETAFEIQAGQTEYEISARLAMHSIKKEVEPIVNLVAADDRIYSRRHPLPTSRNLQKYAMLVVCGRRNGQVVSTTRLIHFGSLSSELKMRHRAVAYIDAALISKTVPGTAYAELFQVLKQAYQDTGFADEWKFHHQGGLSGYHSREQLLFPNDATHQVSQGQTYAWNPSIAGVKSEDTIVTGEHGSEIISLTGNFPMIEISVGGKKINRPDILIR